MKANTSIIKEMNLEKNISNVKNYYFRVNIKMGKEMEKEKNISLLQLS